MNLLVRAVFCLHVNKTLLEIISSNSHNNLCAVTLDIKQSLNSQNPVNFIMKIIK